MRAQVLIDLFVVGQAHCYYGGACADTRASYNFHKAPDQPSYSQLGTPPSTLRAQHATRVAQANFVANYRPVERSGMGIDQFAGGTRGPS